MTDFNVLFPWIGCGIALTLTVLLFATNILHPDLSVSKLKDGTWLAWLACTAYLFHNVEEYGIDIFGNAYAFPAAMEALMPQAAYLPPAFYTVLNVVMFWLCSPFTASLSAKYPFMQASMAGVLLINAIGHFGQFFIIGYTPGLLTVLVLFFPISIWIFVNQFRKGNFSKKKLAMVLLIGVLTHVILIGSMFAFVAGLLSVAVLIFFQVFNSLCYVLLSYLGNRL